MTRHRFLDHDLAQLAVFLGGAALSLTLSIALAGMSSGALGNVAPMVFSAMASAGFSVLTLALSAWLLRRQQQTLAVLGLPTSMLRVRQCLIGVLVTVPIFIGVAWVQSRAVGARLEWRGIESVVRAMAALPLVASMVLAEELLFRGYAFRSLRALLGDRTAVLLSALCFGAYHLIGSNDWAMGAVFRFLMPTLGGVLFGWAAIRGKGLALPIGLHAGGNWVQASIAVFQPVALSSPEPLPGVWRIAITADDMRTLMAPDVSARLPYLLALVLAAAAVVLVCREAPRRRAGGAGMS